MAQDTRIKNPPDGFICAGCGRASYHMALAPYCYRCREETDNPSSPLPPWPRSGWRLMFWFMWDAVFHRSSDAYAKWDQDQAPSYPHKREDQL
jgi:hypothetical protein